MWICRLGLLLLSLLSVLLHLKLLLLTVDHVGLTTLGNPCHLSLMLLHGRVICRRGLSIDHVSRLGRGTTAVH